MGCFNKVGFYSHLPIKSGDEIVYFICASYGVIDDIAPLNINSFIEPISLPLFGLYNEYGSIEDIEHNHYTEAIEKSVKMSIDEFVELIEETSLLTIKELKSNDTDFYNVGNNKKCKKILERMFDSLSYFTKKKSKDISLCVTMEHRSVYETICNMHKHLVTEYEYEFQRIKFPVYFDNTFNFINEHSVKKVNIFSNNNSVNTRNIFELQMKGYDALEKGKDSQPFKKKIEEIKREENDEEDKKRNDFDIFNEIPTNTIYNIFSFDMMLLSILDLDYNKIKDLVYDFTFFNISLSKICGRYDLSNYGSQQLSSMKNEYNTLNNCYQQIIDKLYGND